MSLSRYFSLRHWTTNRSRAVQKRLLQAAHIVWFFDFLSASHLPDTSSHPLSPIPVATPGPLSWTLPNWEIAWNRLKNFYFLHMEQSVERATSLITFDSHKQIQPSLTNNSDHLQTTFLGLNLTQGWTSTVENLFFLILFVLHFF